MNLILFIVVPVLAGALAQLWKGRLGVVWGALVLLLQFVAFAVLAPIQASEPALAGSPHASLVLILMSAIVGGGLGLLIVATLPSKKRA